MSQIEILDCFDRAAESTLLGDVAARIDRTLSAGEIVSRTGLPRSTMFRDLRALVTAGFVYQDPVTKRYALGPRILQLGVAARRQLGSENTVLVPLLQLVADTRETVTFSVLDVPWRICVYAVEAPSELRQFAQAGARYPLHLGAAGKAILAYLSSDAVKAVLAGHEVTRQRASELVDELPRIRAAGVAQSAGERVPGTASVAAPIFVGSAIFGSVAVAGPAERILSRMAEDHALVLEVAHGLTERFSSRSQPAKRARSHRVSAARQE